MDITPGSGDNFRVGMLPRRIRRGVLRKLREAVGLSQEAAAQRIGISVRALRAQESVKPPDTMRPSNLHALAKLYKVKVDELLEPVVAAHLLRQTLTPPQQHTAAPAAPELEASINGGAGTTGLPVLSTLSQRAERERALGLHEVEVETSAGEKLPVMGLTWFKRIWSRPAKYDGVRFAIVGLVDDHQGLSRPLRTTLKVQDGGKYRVVRWLDAETFFYTTVFALTSDQADVLTPLAETKQPAAMIVRVMCKPPKGKSWPGFYYYGSDRVAFEFGFICESIVSDWRDLHGPRLNVLPPATGNGTNE